MIPARYLCCYVKVWQNIWLKENTHMILSFVNIDSNIKTLRLHVNSYTGCPWINQEGCKSPRSEYLSWANKQSWQSITVLRHLEVSVFCVWLGQGCCKHTLFSTKWREEVLLTREDTSAWWTLNFCLQNQCIPLTLSHWHTYFYSYKALYSENRIYKESKESHTHKKKRQQHSRLCVILSDC